MGKRKKLTTDELIKWCEKEATRNAQLQGDKPNHSARRRKTFRWRNHMLTAVANRIKVLEAGIKSVEELIADSEGVYGLHLNGDGAPWESLRAGGSFEEWLLDFDKAQEAGE
jgi:hypothetical protein